MNNETGTSDIPELGEEFFENAILTGPGESLIDNTTVILGLQEELRVLRHVHESDRREIKKLLMLNKELRSDLKIICEIWRGE